MQGKMKYSNQLERRFKNLKKNRAIIIKKRKKVNKINNLNKEKKKNLKNKILNKIKMMMMKTLKIVNGNQMILIY